MFGKANASATTKKPTIRRETVLVPVKKPQQQQQQNLNGVRKPAPATARPPANRFQLSETPGANHVKPLSKSKSPAQRAIAASRGVKRKSNTPDRALFSSDEDDDGSSDIGTSDSDVSRKRVKSSVSSLGSGDVRRDLVLEAAFHSSNGVDYMHGADCTSGVYESKFKIPWEQEEFETAEVQYPTASRRERFELKWPKNEADDYKPMEDIIQTIMQIATHYFTEELRVKYMNEENGFERRFNRAWKRQSISEFKSVVDEFNSILRPLVEDGTIERELRSKRHLPLDLVRRVMEQIYSRTVSPKVETLRAYKNGGDNVYGELRERFCSDIFSKTKLNHEHIFVDLGSGVGNVVLQAALETGCESWGIEMMKNPCDLAELQAKEFPGRTQLWGIKVGAVHLLRGDFTKTPEISKALQRADVVLVNNQAFTPELNDKLRDMFLDLKDSCQVVSLKPFVPEGHKITQRNISSVANLFVQKRFEYFSGSVSWTDQSGYYYIATKDRKPLEKFIRESQR